MAALHQAQRKLEEDQAISLAIAFIDSLHFFFASTIPAPWVCMLYSQETGFS
jgi:hypothetical protein